jgi:hypothetical protein
MAYGPEIGVSVHWHEEPEGKCRAALRGGGASIEEAILNMQNPGDPNLQLIGSVSERFAWSVAWYASFAEKTSS